ncbi:MAG TPA: exosortase/archaeosortase family protein [Chthoniobacteraceae bacterium]|jgi:exosortase
MAKSSTNRARPSFKATMKSACAPFLEWVKGEPVQALLVLGIFAVLTYFFGIYGPFADGTESAAVWAWRAWNPENNLEHGPFILPIALGIVWYHRRELRAAIKPSSPVGLGFVVLGIGLYILSVRTLEPRIALVAIPVLAYGAARFIWGWDTARRLIFPCAFLLFMVPVGFLIQRTAGLQALTANVAAKLSTMVGIGVVADGTHIEATNGAFHFDVIGGCSGIRSLTAMTMLAALYVYFTQKEMWKMALIFCGSLVFALFGNFVRIFSVVLVARFAGQETANTYHDYSGIVFFLSALGAMVLFSNLLNLDFSGKLDRALTPVVKPPVRSPRRPAPAAANSEEKPTAAPPRASSYDY